MTKKDYVLIAGVISKQPMRVAKKNVAIDFADALAQDNPLFNRDTFLRACGVYAHRKVQEQEKT